MARALPLYRDPVGLACVFLGATAGTLLRARAALTVAGVWHISHVSIYSTLLVNLLGALCLGAIAGFLAEIGPLERNISLLYLFIGSGFMGAFTTYSTFCWEVVSIIRTGSLLGALTYAVLSVLGGAFLAFLGLHYSGSFARYVRTQAGGTRPCSVHKDDDKGGVSGGEKEE